ncbi:cadmium-translocating P-type ATPase [Chitinophaga sp. MAH-28]|uniref:Cadmium-translocating P-type ATPase n=2 Tax=Chitinophagaceae TaxID=563835 RepID=A0ABS3YCA1_9BACT|nr:cadmium-translocating P-type ATPase [Chitinophaga chungangae]
MPQPAPHHHENPPHGAAGHDHHAMMTGDFRKRFYVTLILTVPVLLLSPMIQHWLRVNWGFPGSKWLLFALSTVLFVYGGWPFLKGLAEELKARNPGMMTLVGFAISVAYIYSAATVFGLPGMDFFWELATLILIMLLGHWIEMTSVAGASKELELLVKLMPSTAHLLHGDHVMEVETGALKKDDVILVKPGEKIAADGWVEEGQSAVNESMLTGESRPVEKHTGDKVIAGAINGNGALRVKVTHGSAESYLSQVIQLVNDAQRSKSRTQLLADKAARWLTVIAIAAGLITFAAWYFSGSTLAFAIERMVTVIVICCPHALGLAVPLVVAKSTSMAARQGLLIKNRTAFENARKITTLVFDKTGTLTVGQFAVVRHGSLDKNLPDDEVLRLAYALEQGSEHPIATGIVQKAKEMGLTAEKAENITAITGKGITATVNGRKVSVVSPNALAEQPEAIRAGETLVYVQQDGRTAGYIALSDKVRPESAEAIRILQGQQIKTVLLTGDNQTVAESVSRELGMDQYFAEVLPHEKLEKIVSLQQAGEYVAMTGDGVNDAPALAKADVGIAVGSGSDVAAETADIVLVNSNPKDVANLVLFGKATYRKMIQNLAWATGYNIVALPLAAGVLSGMGILLSPAAGAVLMSVSTIVVAINAGMLKIRD